MHKNTYFMNKVIYSTIAILEILAKLAKIAPNLQNRHEYQISQYSPK
jgi:hypothetical protein